MITAIKEALFAAGLNEQKVNNLISTIELSYANLIIEISRLSKENNALRSRVREIDLTYESGLCGCIGPINGDPLCPCKMRLERQKTAARNLLADEIIKNEEVIQKLATLLAKSMWSRRTASPTWSTFVQEIEDEAGKLGVFPHPYKSEKVIK